MSESVERTHESWNSLAPMTMHPQTKAFLDYTAANNPMPADATLEERRADAADYLKYAGPESNDVRTEHTYFTSLTADLHAVIYRPKNVKPSAHQQHQLDSYPLY
jgi:acetyl esterase